MVSVLVLCIRSGSYLVEKNIVHDRKQPRTQIATRAPQIKAFPGPLDGILNEILRRGVITRERSRVTAQLRNMCGYTFSVVHKFKSGFGRWEWIKR